MGICFWLMTVGPNFFTFIKEFFWDDWPEDEEELKIEFED